MWTPSYEVDILAVSRLINGTIYREKTEIINPWGVRRLPQPPLNDAPAVIWIRGKEALFFPFFYLAFFLHLLSLSPV